jgi:hypothetical protein
VSFDQVRDKVNNMEEQELEDLLKDIKLVLTSEIITTSQAINDLPPQETIVNPIQQKIGEQLKASLFARFNATKTQLEMLEKAAEDKAKE